MTARLPRITLAARAPYLIAAPAPRGTPSPTIAFQLDLIAEQASRDTGADRDEMRATIYKLAGYAPPT